MPHARRQSEVEELARAVVRRVLGADARIQEVDPVQVAETSTVLVLTVGHPLQRLVFKAAQPAAVTGTDFARTAAVIDLARAAGVPVAAVLAVHTSGHSGAWHYLLQEHVPGVEWRRLRPRLDDDQVASAHRQIAEAVLAIQAVRFAGFGALDPSGRSAGGSLLAGLRERAASRILRPHHRRAFASLLDREADLFGDPPAGATLCHDDLHHSNVIFDRQDGRWRLTGVLDWDKAWAGPAESDVARMAFWDDMTGPEFWRVYRSAVAAQPGHEQRRLIYQLMWCLEYDDGTDRHAVDTKTLLHRLDLEVGPADE